jgi:peptidoglycan/xylan/chitin deacetylase (PgdA/CDA1 family)
MECIHRSLPLLIVAVLPLLAGWGFPKPPRFPTPPPPVLWLPEPLPARVIDVPILEYHRIGTTAGLSGLTVSPSDFAAEMEWLHAAGFHAVTQRQVFHALERGGRLPRRPVMITFDDGYRDVLWHAAGLLHRLRMPATEYVITSRVGAGDPSFLSWPELRRLERMGFTIGSHTVHHVELTRVAALAAYRELWSSRRTLERHLGRPVEWVAYPLGAADDRVASIAAAAGYVLGVTERPGNAQSAGEPLLLHREEILPTIGLAQFQALVESP